MITFSTRSWIKNWESAIKDSDDLLFNLTVENITEYLVDCIDANPRNHPFKKESYELKLLLYLNRLISGTSLEPTLLRKHRLLTIRNLNGYVSSIQSQITGGQRLTIDIKRIRRNLNRINQFYYSKEILEEIETIIIKCIRQNTYSDDLHIATSILLRLLIIKYSPKFLSEFPSKIFAEHFFGSQKTSLINKIKNDNEVIKEFKNFVTLIVKHSVTTAKRHSGPRKSAKLANFIIDRNMMMYGNVPWIAKSVRKFIRSVKQFNKLSITKPAPVNLRIFREAMKDPQVKRSIDKLLQDYVSDILSPVVYQCVGHLDPLKGDSKLKDHRFGIQYSKIAKGIWYGGEAQPLTNFIYPILESSYISVRRSYTKKISQQFLQNYGNKEKKRLVAMIKDLMEKEISNPSKYYFQNKKKIIDRVTDSFELDKVLSKSIRDMLTQNISDILKIITQTAPNSLFGERKRMLDYQIEVFLKELKRSSYYNGQIPDELSLDKSVMLFKKFFRELALEKKKFRVFCLIGGLDCKERAFNVGKVVFYDARKWEFGESNDLDRHYNAPLSSDQRFTSSYETYEKIEMREGEFLESKRNSGRAYVDVVATDQKRAIRKATAAIRESLTTLVYASSAYDSHGGFQPTLPSHYAVVQKEGRSSTLGRDGATPRTLEINENYDKIITFYNQLITRKKTRFDESILKSFMWFQKGKWENIQYEKFLSYWIALEQLILTHTENSRNRKGHKVRLLKYVPRLSVTWRKSDGAFVINNYLKSIAAMITPRSSIGQYLGNNLDRRRWKENYAILLEHLPTMITLSNRTHLRKSLEGLQDFIEKRIKQIRYECNWKLQIQKFKIARIYEKRNLIVHEGIIDDNEIPMMVTALEKVLVDVLRPFLEFREGRTTNQIIEEIQRPYRLREGTLS